MKKIKVLLLFLLFSQIVFAKTTVKGTILSADNQPLVGAVVYVNFTANFVYSDKNGQFKLTFSEKNPTIIASFSGFIPQKIALSEITDNNSVSIVLQPKNEPKRELSIKVWNYTFKVFRNLFLGKTLFSKDCEIKNKAVLHFSFDVSSGYLKATASAPLIIENKALGYFIYYDITEFESTAKGTSYNGYVRFLNIETNKMLWRKINKNRKRAYKGSRMHFFRALQDDNLEKEGFFIDQYKRYPNPDRPSESEIQKARGIVMENFSSISYLKDITDPKTALDSAIVVLRKISLHTQIEELIKKRVSYFDMIEKKEGKTYLKFQDYIKIYYTKEGEEEAFYKSVYTGYKREQGYQITNIKLLTNRVELNKNGSLVHPLNLLIDGYWAFERVADMLPLDYFLPEKD